jgi:hypothetical protein
LMIGVIRLIIRWIRIVTGVICISHKKISFATVSWVLEHIVVRIIISIITIYFICTITVNTKRWIRGFTISQSL